MGCFHQLSGLSYQSRLHSLDSGLEVLIKSLDERDFSFLSFKQMCNGTYLTVQHPHPVAKLQSTSARGMAPAEAMEARATAGARIEAERIMRMVILRGVG